MNKLRQQVLDSMREYIGRDWPDSAPPEVKRAMVSGLLIFAARAGILSTSQYRRLQRIKMNNYKTNKEKPLPTKAEFIKSAIEEFGKEQRPPEDPL